jgi:5-methylcytosine-specific restriction enzyme subunit McrC
VRRVEMTAWATEHVALSHSEAAEMARSGLAEVVAEPHVGEWRVKTGSQVGVAVGDGWELRVRPRLDVSKLMFLLGYARDPAGWRGDLAGFAADPDLFDAVAHAFSLQTTTALERGILRGYVHLSDRLMTVRGRVLFAQQLARGGGMRVPVDVAHDEYTLDILENQLLRTAATLLLRLPRVPASTRRRLHAIRGALDEASLVERPREARMPALTRLNARYGSAMKLAELILLSASLDAGLGEITGTTFSFDMNVVFEDFLTTALTEALAETGGEVRRQHIDKLDVSGDVRIQPDITWWLDGRCVAVVDAKYKALASSGVRNPDAYQMLAYCTALDLPVGFLVYARESGEQVADHDIRNSRSQIRVRTVDLGGSPEDVLLRVAALATEVKFTSVGHVARAA